MTLIVRLALRNASRNLTRTALTALTVLFGTGLLTLALSWMEGVFGQLLGTSAAQAGHVRLVDPDYLAREQLFPLYEHLPDAGPLAQRFAAKPGVVAAYPRILTGVTITASEEIGENFALATGAPLAWYTEQLHLDADVATGRWFTGAEGEIVLGATVAERIGAKVGQEIVLVGQTQDGAVSPWKGTLVGVVSTGSALVDQGAFLPLEPVQYLADIGGGATELLLYGSDRDDAATLGAQLAADPDSAGMVVQAWSHRDPWAGMIAISTIVRRVLNTVIVFITALGVWNTMMMSVLERTGEIGVMRSMGLTRLGTVALFVLEALAIAALGGVAGVAIGALGGLYLETYGVELGDQLTQNLDAAIPFQTRLYADVTLPVLVRSFGLGLAMALFGAGVPSLRAASIQPVEAMRERR
jgi:putative ABC transport system permease protein